MNNYMLYEKNIENIKKEIDYLEKSTDFLKDEKIKILKEQLNTFEQIIAKRNKIKKLKNERNNAENNNTYISKKEEINDLYKEINTLKEKYHSKYGYKNVLSSFFNQTNKRISNFMNQSNFIYKLRRANYNLRYDHIVLNTILKTALSGITLFAFPNIIGAIPLIITLGNSTITFLKRTKSDFERKKPVLRGRFLDNIALSLYGYGKSRVILNTLINTMNNKKSSNVIKKDVENDAKNVEMEEDTELVNNEKTNSNNKYDYYMDELGLKEKPIPVKGNTTNSEKNINIDYYLKDLGFEVKDKKENKDDWILKAKIKKVINKVTNEQYPEMTCLFYADGKKVKQETFRLDSLTDNNDYIVIRDCLMHKYPFLKKEPDITISNTEKIIEKSKNKSL